MVILNIRIMPFGLTNIPVIFQGYINKIFVEKLDIFIIVYLDNIFIYTKDKEKSHVQVVRWDLNQLWKLFLYANLKKCQFHQEDI